MSRMRNADILPLSRRHQSLELAAGGGESPVFLAGLHPSGVQFLPCSAGIGVMMEYPMIQMLHIFAILTEF